MKRTNERLSKILSNVDCYSYNLELLPGILDLARTCVKPSTFSHIT